jgi:hypothetical protein
MADTNPTTEEWRAIPSLGQYSASSFGRIRHDVATHRYPAGHICAQSMTVKGYLHVNVKTPTGWALGASAHRFVFEAFSRALLPGEEVNHLDGVKSNNAPSNLEAVTPVENNRHAVRTGLVRLGSARPRAKLTEVDVLSIRERYRRGEHIPALGKAYGISTMTAWAVATGRAWRHVKF